MQFSELAYPVVKGVWDVGNVFCTMPLQFSPAAPEMPQYAKEQFTVPSAPRPGDHSL